MIISEKFPRCIICKETGDLLYESLEDRLLGGIDGKFNLRRCLSCGLLWLDPQPKAGQISELYANFYMANEIIMDPLIYQRRLFASLRDILRESIICGYYGYRHIHAKHLLCRFATLLAKNPILRSRAIYGLDEFFPFYKNNPNALIVDIGCGKGDYLEMMQHMGWKVLGIEPYSVIAGITENKGIPIFKGTLSEARLPDSFADQVTMNHVIEHLHDPISELKECLRILKPAGRLVIRTPNTDSLGHRIFNKHWLALEVPRHLYLFSFNSLYKILKGLPSRNFYLKTLTSRSKICYDKSMIISKLGKIDLKKVKPQWGRYWFALKESVSCYFDRKLGEEIEAVVIK